MKIECLATIDEKPVVIVNRFNKKSEYYINPKHISYKSEVIPIESFEINPHGDYWNDGIKHHEYEDDEEFY